MRTASGRLASPWTIGSTLVLSLLPLLGAWTVAGASAPSDPPAKPPSPPASKPAPARDAAPIVVSTAKANEGRRSSFLRPPGAGRYDAEPDWRDVPPWRQTSFFGIRAEGRFFIYVVDCSGSMIDEDRLARAKEELRRSVKDLQDPQRFLVIFYNDAPIAMPGGLPRTADLAAKDQFLAWLRLIEPDGETDPKPALGVGLALRPDAIFLLSDGEYPEGTAAAIAARNRQKVPIHCVDLSGGLAGDQLARIARESGGKYVARPWPGP